MRLADLASLVITFLFMLLVMAMVAVELGIKGQTDFCVSHPMIRS